jgi:hypothetical protein
MTPDIALTEMEDRLLSEWVSDGPNWTREQVIGAAQYFKSRQLHQELVNIREVLCCQQM